MILLSIGTSLTILIILGLLTNEILFSFGYLNSLSYFIYTINLFTLFLWIINYIFKKGYYLKSIKSETITKLIPVLILPFLSIYGVILVKETNNNVILLIMLLYICIYISYLILSKNLSSNYYPIILYLISLSILYHSSLISNYLPVFSSDSPLEYYLSQIVKENMHLVSSVSNTDLINRVNSMFSVTLLPVIFYTILNIDTDQIFRLIYPLIFALLPVIVYQIWVKYINEKKSLISSLLLLSFYVYYNEMLGNNKQMIAEIFLALIFLIVLSNDIPEKYRNIFFILFSFSITVSHYAVALILLIFISLFYFTTNLINIIRKNNNLLKFSNNIDLKKVLILFVIMFSWFIFTSNESNLRSIVYEQQQVILSIADIFNINSREQSVLRGLGLEQTDVFIVLISRIFSYITQVLIILGFFSIIYKKDEENIKDFNALLTLTLSIFFVFLMFVIPGLSKTMNMTRLYHLLLIFISPLFPIGFYFLVKSISSFTLLKKYKSLLKIVSSERFKSLLMLLILVPYFLFQTNFIYEVSGAESWSISLSKYRISDSQLKYNTNYIDDFDHSHSIFVRNFVNNNKNTFYADGSSYTIVSYGMALGKTIIPITNITDFEYDSIVLLSEYNINSQKLIGYGRTYNFTQLTNIFTLNKIYSNSKSVSYYR